MLRLTICYGHPSSPEAFDLHYQKVHGPIAQRLPGVQELRFGHCSSIEGARTAGATPYYLVAELDFASSADLHAALASPEGKAAADDLQNFADGGVTLFVQHDISAGPFASA